VVPGRSANDGPFFSQLTYKAVMNHPLRQPFTLCLLLLLLCGCSSDSWESPYRNYAQRLSRTLDQPFTTPEPTLPVRMPRPSEIRQQFETDQIDGLDFLALRGCELQLTIGKKNSSLGRMARDSQRLLLELEFLQLAPGCIAVLQAEGKNTLAATLQQAWSDKQHQLPRRIFNATLGSTEYRQLWQANPPSRNYPEGTSANPLQALDQVNALVKRWLGGDYSFDNRSFELLLSEVAKGDGGQLWYALAIQQAWLASSNSALQRRQQQGPLCSENYRDDAADILPNVVARFFVNGTQARAAQLGRRYHQLLPPLQKLEQLLSAHLPATYTAWKSERDSRLAVLASAPREHVRQLQALQAPCKDHLL
jgi:Protein of unknown function (DUF3080)